MLQIQIVVANTCQSFRSTKGDGNVDGCTADFRNVRRDGTDHWLLGAREMSLIIMKAVLWWTAMIIPKDIRAVFCKKSALEIKMSKSLMKNKVIHVRMNTIMCKLLSEMF